MWLVQSVPTDIAAAAVGIASVMSGVIAILWRELKVERMSKDALSERVFTTLAETNHALGSLTDLIWQAYGAPDDANPKPAGPKPPLRRRPH